MQASTSGITDDYDYENDYFNLQARLGVDYEIQDFLARVDPDVRSDFGHQIEDMLVDCVYKNKECSVE